MAPPWLPMSLVVLMALGLTLGQDQTLVWNTVYKLEGEHTLSKGFLLETIPKLPKGWKVSFEVKPTDYKYKSYASVLHLTIGGKSGKIGDRTPAIWFHKTRGVLISTAMDGKATYSKQYRKHLPPTGKWTKFEVSQSLLEGHYIFSLDIGGSNVFSKPNSKPVELENVKVYSGSPWYEEQKGSIRNLKIEVPAQCVLPGKNCLLMFLLSQNVFFPLTLQRIISRFFAIHTE